MKYIYGFLHGLLLGSVICYATLLIVEYRKNLAIKGNYIPAINSYVNNINMGGCGFFALKLYDRLDTSEYSLVTIGKKNTHIAILEKSTGLLIDANGYHHRLSFQLRGHIEINVIKRDSLIKLLKVDSVWNKSFNRQDTSVINAFVNQL